VRTRPLVRILAALLLTITLYSLPVRGQTTIDALQARLVGQPLYLRVAWMDDDLHFDADGRLEKKYRQGSFTEAGIDVSTVKLKDGQLYVEGQRMGLIFEKMVPRRVKLSSQDYGGTISIQIKSPASGDFDQPLTAIFAPDLASLVPSMPSYWQDYAQKNLLAPTVGDATDQNAKPGSGSSKAAAVDAEKPFHIGGSVTKPVVVHMEDPQFSAASRALKYSGNVQVFLWILPDGSTSHLRIVKPAGLGLDEQALLAVSKYKFKPATKDGEPVKVDLYVDVKFQLQ